MSGPSFTLSTPSGTDIWRKPPSTNRFNAPTSAPTLRGSLKQFQSAELTFSFSPTVQYDQAGLLLHLTKPGQHECSANDGQADDITVESDRHSSCKWLKTGVEFYEGDALVSTVGCDMYADWSVLPLAATDAAHESGSGAVKDVTILARRERDENGKGLWVYQVVNGKQIPLREVAWFFALEDEGWQVEGAAYVCRPKDADGHLAAEYTGLDVVFKN